MKETILDGQERIKSLVSKPRDFTFDLDFLKIHKFISFIGARRVGKTHIMLATVQNLVRQGIIAYEDVIFIDFNEFVDNNFDFQQLLLEYLSIYPDRTPFFVFDEIQEVDNFRPGLFSLYNKGYHVFLSGSNSKLLSSELTTHFRGKVYEYRIYPLSLFEFLRFNDFEIKSYYSTLEQGKLQHLIELYLNYGGYPEIALVSDVHKKIDIAKTYLDVMIYKDILERYRIENEYALKYCIKRMLESSSKQLSVNNIYKDLKSHNIKISINSLYDIVQYLQNVFFVDLLENYYNPKGQKKIYPIDTIYHNIYAKNINSGQKYETAVYHLLCSMTKEDVYYKKQTEEIDFYTSKRGDIQVCYHLTVDNILRETKHLQHGSFLISAQYTPDLMQYCQDRGIQLLNLYQFANLLQR